MYTITTGIHLHFAHHIRGHAGPCISVHGHTWKFEISLCARELDGQGFVVDFDDLQDRVLSPCHQLLDHSLALGEQSFQENAEVLSQLGNRLVDTRCETIGDRGQMQDCLQGSLANARNEHPGGIKLAVFPFSPTSERLAKWLFEATQSMVGDDRVQVASARIFETLHPTESMAQYQSQSPL